MREFLDDEIREHTTKMTPEKCMEFAEIMTKIGRELSKADVMIDGEPLQRYIYWNVMKCYWNEELGYDYSMAVNFDWYHPAYAHRHTPEEIEQWVDDAGLKMENFDVSKSGMSIRAEKL